MHEDVGRERGPNESSPERPLRQVRRGRHASASGWILTSTIREAGRIGIPLL